MIRSKFPLKILKSNQKDKFKITTSIDNISRRSTNIRQELSYLEEDYSLLIKIIRDVIFLSSKSKKADPRLFWLAGEYIYRFLERIENMDFYLIKQNNTIARDVGVSESSIKKILAFRKRFVKLSMINPSIPWKKYRDNKIPVSDDI
ncbi:MAG: hypothetical protein HXY47_08765 [Nitrospirae bacterium]|nr:hypothetical protein [Nitrospirota bacterium]